MSAPYDTLPRLLAERYLLEAKLGAGGMGVVYRAFDQTMRRRVAVKLVQASESATIDDEVEGRFLREARNTARLRHEHIVDVYDLGQSESFEMFFVMELLEGESLAAKIRRMGTLPPSLTVHLARQMCAALHVAHEYGIVHRDLKPANVMIVAKGDDADFVKVLDFGVAKAQSVDQRTRLTRTGMLIGTVDYMAPEQILGRTVDGRTDLYALGVVMYRMLTGRAPFRDGGPAAVIQAHLNEAPRSSTAHHPSPSPIARSLDRIVLRCLAKEPNDRYATMNELSDALAQALATPEVQWAHDDAADVYAAFDRTRIASKSTPTPDEKHASEVDDATRKWERALPLRETIDTRTEWLKRPLPSSIPAPYSLEHATPCALCKTLNPALRGTCQACGVSLSPTEQDAVRAQMAAAQHARAVRRSQPAGPARPTWVAPPSVWQRLLAWAKRG
jgi:serine/threonine-protein kinase